VIARGTVRSRRPAGPGPDIRRTGSQKRPGTLLFRRLDTTRLQALGRATTALRALPRPIDIPFGFGGAVIPRTAIRPRRRSGPGPNSTTRLRSTRRTTTALRALPRRVVDHPVGAGSAARRGP